MPTPDELAAADTEIAPEERAPEEPQTSGTNAAGEPTDAEGNPDLSEVPPGAPDEELAAAYATDADPRPEPATIGDHAARTAADAEIEGTRFSYKANGIILDPSNSCAQADLDTVASLELIEVTDTAYDTQAPEAPGPEQ